MRGAREGPRAWDAPRVRLELLSSLLADEPGGPGEGGAGCHFDGSSTPLALYPVLDELLCAAVRPRFAGLAFVGCASALAPAREGRAETALRALEGLLALFLRGLRRLIAEGDFCPAVRWGGVRVVTAEGERFEPLGAGAGASGELRWLVGEALPPGAHAADTFAFALAPAPSAAGASLARALLPVPPRRCRLRRATFGADGVARYREVTGATLGAGVNLATEDALRRALASAPRDTPVVFLCQAEEAAAHLVGTLGRFARVHRVSAASAFPLRDGDVLVWDVKGDSGANVDDRALHRSTLAISLFEGAAGGARLGSACFAQALAGDSVEKYSRAALRLGAPWAKAQGGCTLTFI